MTEWKEEVAPSQGIAYKEGALITGTTVVKNTNFISLPSRLNFFYLNVLSI